MRCRKRRKQRSTVACSPARIRVTWTERFGASPPTARRIPRPPSPVPRPLSEKLADLQFFIRAFDRRIECRQDVLLADFIDQHRASQGLQRLWLHLAEEHHRAVMPAAMHDVL